jgi:hypothetical protein
LGAAGVEPAGQGAPEGLVPAVDPDAPALFVFGVGDDPEFAEPDAGAEFWSAGFAELVSGVVLEVELFDPAIGAHGVALVPAGGVAGEVDGVAVLPEVEFPFVVDLLPLVLG